MRLVSIAVMATLVAASGTALANSPPTAGQPLKVTFGNGQVETIEGRYATRIVAEQKTRGSSIPGRTTTAGAIQCHWKARVEVERQACSQGASGARCLPDLARTLDHGDHADALTLDRSRSGSCAANAGEIAADAARLKARAAEALPQLVARDRPRLEAELRQRADVVQLSAN